MNTAEILSQLRAGGFAVVGRLSPCQVAETVAHLQASRTYPDCHVRYTAGPEGSFGGYRDRHVVCHHNHDVLTAPHLLELALSLTDIAAAWLGREVPVMYSCNAFWTRPGGPLRPDIQEFHVDKDNDGATGSGFLPLFVFLTDVPEEDGAQEILVDGRVRRIFGPAGTAFLSNTGLHHRGLRPRGRERGIVWFRWGAADVPAAYTWDQLTPLDRAALGDRYPTDLRLQASIGLLVQ